MRRIQRSASYRLKKWAGRLPPYPFTLQPSAPLRGRVLLSYIPDVLNLPEDALELEGHTNKWESREIARIFVKLGFSVDAIWYNDHKFIPKRSYDAVFDIYTNLARLAPVLPDETIKIMYCTGSDPFYQNAAERARVEAMNRRRHGTYMPKRSVADPEGERRSLEVANAILLMGNPHTRQTFPDPIQRRMTLIHATPSNLGDNTKSPEAYVPPEREFLWFFGAGAVHKGLDLVLEVFARHPEWVLNVVGPASDEPDFVALYRHELYELPNIRYHGQLTPSGEAFRAIVSRSFCFIAPSCSEGTSPAVVTCLYVGLYPIISRDTGVTLPDGNGIYLETSNIEEIESTVQYVYRLPDHVLRQQIEQIQIHATNQFSHESFRANMIRFLCQALAPYL